MLVSVVAKKAGSAADDDAAAGGGPRTTTMTAITTTTTTNDADAITGRAVRAGPDVKWTTQEGCLFVMGGGEVLRFFECHNIIFSYGICHGHPAPRKNSHGACSTCVGIVRVHFRVPKPQNMFVLQIYLAATLGE